MNLVMRKQWSRGSRNEELNPPCGSTDGTEASGAVAEGAAWRRTWQKRDSGYSCGTTKPEATLWRHLGVLVSLRMEINNKRWESISWKKNNILEV